MSQPIAVDILSDDDDDEHPNNGVSTHFPTQSKRKRTESNPNPTVFVIDDDPTPRKPAAPTSTPSFVAETPMSDCSTSGVSIVKCTKGVSGPQLRSTSMPDSKYFGISRLICLESDNESENVSGSEIKKQNAPPFVSFEAARDSELGYSVINSTSLLGNANTPQICEDSSSHPILSEDYIAQVHDHPDEEIGRLQPMDNALRPNGRRKDKANKKTNMDEAKGKQRITKEERIRLMEEKKQQKEQEKLQKAAMKAEAVEMKKLQKEMQKWEKGKFALKSIVAEIDTKVVELGSVGGHLLTRLAEKGVTYRITSNPIERSVVWTMTVPEPISQLSSRGIEIPYVLLVYEADEFCNLVRNGSLMDHASSVQSRYPSHTICYLTNRLMGYINKSGWCNIIDWLNNWKPKTRTVGPTRLQQAQCFFGPKERIQDTHDKSKLSIVRVRQETSEDFPSADREQGQYKDPASNSGWRRPPVEEVLSKLITYFVRVHSRQCIDEAELAEHVVGLTCSLASCQFRKKLTRLSVNANGSLIPKDCVDKTSIKKNLWLKALVAIPKVQPRFALAIWKKYPTMKSLLGVYMDPSKSVHQKEFLLKDLMTEGLLGEDRRLGEICSKRVYRILMAQCGSIKTDDVEDGADFFSSRQSS